MKNNNTPTNHMKKAAKNNVFVFSEDITAAQFFFFALREKKQRPVFFFSPFAKKKQRPNLFFTHTAKTKKSTPVCFFVFGEFNAATINGACGAGMLRPPNPMLRQGAHGLRRVLREMAISTQMLRQRNRATAN